MRLGGVLAITIAAALVAAPSLFGRQQGTAGVPWVGTLDSQTSRVYSGGDGSCTDGWHVELKFTVTGNTIDGTGKATLTAGPDCTVISRLSPVTQIALGITGSADSDTLRLKLLDRGNTPGLPAVLYAGFSSDFPTGFGDPTMAVPKIDACTARGSPTTSATLPTGDVLSSRNTISLKCGPCDPSLLLKSDAEFKRADVLFGEADTKFFKSQGEYDAWLADEAKDFAEIGLEKGTLIQIVKGGGKKIGLEQVAGKVVDVFEDDLGPVFTTYWIADDVFPHALQHDADMKEVAQLSKMGFKTGEQGVADLKTELAQEPACEEQAKAQRAKEDLEAKKRALVNSWLMTPHNLYWNPTRGEWETERAALKAAEQILTGTRKVQAHEAHPKSKKVKITAVQARAALRYVEKALRFHRRAMAGERRAQTRTKAFAKAMKKLLARSK